MKNIFAYIAFMMLIHTITAQEIHTSLSQYPVSITQQDSIIVITKMGSPFNSVTVENGIVVTTTPYPYIPLDGNPTAIHDLPLIEGIKVYPNPTSEIAMLQRKQSNDKLIVRLYDVNGVNIVEQSWNDGSINMSVSLERLARGIYILSVMNEKETMASQFKIIKQ